MNYIYLFTCDHHSYLQVSQKKKKKPIAVHIVNLLKLTKGKVNRWSKIINLENIFKNFYAKRKKRINIFNGFLYFMLKWCQNIPKIIY